VPRVWLIIAILVFSNPARALESPGPPDLDRPETLNWALHDHPLELHTWIKSAYRALDRQKHSVQRVRAFAYYAQLVFYRNMSWDETESMQDVAEEALKISLDRGWIEEYLHLYTLFREPQNGQERASPEDRTKFYQDTLALIRKLGGSPYILQKMKMEYAQHLESIGQLQEGLRIAKETYEAVQNDPTIPPLPKLVNLMNMADFFNKTGEFDRAKTIWDITYRELSRSRLRSLTIATMNTIGHQYFRQHTAASYEKAAAFYQQALVAAQALNDESQVAYIHVSLSRLAWKRKDSQEGIRQAEKSLAILERLDDRPWIGEAWLQKSRNQLELGHYQDALNSAIKAQQHYDPNNLFDQRYVEQIKAEAFKGLKRYDEAFAALKLAYEIDSKLAKEQSHAEVSSQLADLGLKVEQAKSEALTRENDQKERELEAAQRFKIILLILLVLAVLVIGLMIFSLHEKKLLTISQKKIRAILDHIDEAIVLIKPDLTIESEYSRFLESLFESAPQSLTGAHAIHDVIRHFLENADDATIMANALQACFHEDGTVWELNEGHLLQESQRLMQGQLRYFSFHWQAIFDRESRLVRVILGIRDVTSRKRMEAEFAAERQEKFGLFERVHELLSVSRQQVVTILDRLLLLQADDNISRVRFELHGIKGLCRTLRLRGLAEAIHNMESALPQARAVDWQMLHTVINSYRHILDEILTTHEANSLIESGLAAIMSSLLPDLKARAEENKLSWRSIELDDRIKDWGASEYEIIRELLLHATSNSLDHGYKFPRQRGEPVQAFHLRISCAEQEGFFKLHVQDAGAGINWTALAEKAQRLQLSWQNQDELAAVLFMEGVSTAEQLTATSGRGVGLSAMKYHLEKLGGHIEIHSSPGSGTEVICTWPRTGQKDQNKLGA
jgi:tetratricopeptide (TPR) repeat protein